MPRPGTLQIILLVQAPHPLYAQPTSTNGDAERIKAFNPTPEKPFVLGLPTGSSPVLIYRSLVQRHKAGEVSFRDVVTFNMVRLTLQYPFAAQRGTAAWFEREADRRRTSMLGYRANTRRATTASCTSTSSPM